MRTPYPAFHKEWNCFDITNNFFHIIFLPLNMDKEEKKLILELICNEQIHMIIKDHIKHESDKYKKLEELKVKIKDL